MPDRRRAALRASVLHIAACSVVLFGCQSSAKPKPPSCRPSDLSGCIIEDVEVLGNYTIPAADIKAHIATAESAHALGGALQGIPVIGLSDLLSVEYEYFDRLVLERDLQRVERYYRARGFYEARVTAGRVMRRKSDGRVRVEIVVDEGLPVAIGQVNLLWKDWHLPEAADVGKPVAEAKNELASGGRFEEEQYEKTKKKLARIMTDRGFAYASVTGSVRVDLVTHRADVTYTLELGPKSKFGAIEILGLGELPEELVRRSLGFKEGDPFSTETLSSAERALGDFGVFGAIDIRPELSPSDQAANPTIPVTIRVQPTALRAVKLGVGAEAGARVEAHVSASWESRNFFGGMRRLAIEARPGVVFYPNGLYNLFAAPPDQILPELRFRFELRQPGVFDPHTQVILRGAVNFYRPQNIITSPAPGSDDAKAPVLGYREYSGTLGIERRLVDFQHYLGQFIHIQLDDPFLYPLWSGEHPSGFSRFLLMYLETVGNLDFRRDDRGEIERVSPRKGVYFGLNAQVAGMFLPGDADDVRLRPDLRAYMPIARRVTLAFHLSGGLLLPLTNDYAETLDILETKAKAAQEVDVDNDGIVDGTTMPVADVQRTLQKLQFRGFYSGGPTSNRGYIFNGVGLHSNVPLRQTGAGPWTATGGLTLWETALELRISVTDKLGGVLFLDGSDVTSGIGDIRLDRPHLSAGLGVRYATPVGPVRLDLGYRLPCAQAIGECDEANIGLDVAHFGYTGGLPLVTTIAIGEAF